MLKNWRQNHRGQWKRREITIPGNKPYIYTPLDDTSQDIRVLTLLPGRFATPLHAYMGIERLSSEKIPEFEALSYTWGLEDNPTELKIESEIESRDLLITADLGEALRHLRYKKRSRQLWIDAICIDQQNIPERNFQITRMGDIYSLSKRVIVWLGPEEHWSSLGIDLIKSLAARVEVNWLEGSMKLKTNKSGSPNSINFGTKLSYTRLEAIAIDMILLRPWFERLWIWQEIWLARPGALMICGKETILWSDFRMAVYPLLTLARLGLTELTRQRKSLLMDLCAMTAPRRFQRLIYCTRYSKCSDSRDRVFALRGLMDDEDKLKHIKPDYNKTTYEVYREVFLFVSEGLGSLSLMAGCQLFSKRSSLPSWIPDWSRPIQIHMLDTCHASGGSQCWIQAREGNKLHVAGVEVATVQKIARHSLPHSATRSDKIDAIRELAAHHDLQPSQYEAFTRALFADCVLKDCYWPGERISDYPTLQNAISVVRTILSGIDDCLPVPWGLPQIVGHIADNIGSRILYTTSDGAFGLAPDYTQPGDKIVVFLGFDQCMILREDEGKDHLVVGAAYHDGHMTGEALLGDLPNTHQLVREIDVARSGSHFAYVEIASGIVRKTDPRVERLIDQWTITDEDRSGAGTSKIFREGVKKRISETIANGEYLSPVMLKWLDVEFRSFTLI